MTTRITKSALVLISASCFFSCVGLSFTVNGVPGKAQETPEAVDRSREEQVYQSWQFERHLSREYQNPANFVQRTHFSHPGEGLPYWVWNTVPASSTPVFLGMAVPHSSPEREKQAALLYAASQAERYRRLVGMTEAIYVHTHLGSYYAEDIHVHYNEENIEALAEEASIIAEFRDNSGTYLLVKFPGVLPPVAFPGLPAGALDRAMTVIPEIPGYRTAVGISPLFYRMSDSLMRADKQVISEILKQSELRIVTEQQFIEEGITSLERDKYEYATGVIQGFLVLARWTDGRYFYSLGIAPH